jgi:hypothetical protein
MSGTPTKRFTVANLDQWGRLVKSWATHLDYITQDYPKQPPRTNWVNQTWSKEAGRTPAPKTMPDKDAAGAPRPWCLPPMIPVKLAAADGTSVSISAVVLTPREFTAKVGAADVTITTMPTQYDNVVIIQGNPKVMVLRLPPQDTLQSSEDDLLNGHGYEIAAFYSELFGGPPSMPTEAPEIMKLHAYRIGEYTLNTCN